MKKIALTSIACNFWFFSFAQYAVMDIHEPIDGICNDSAVYMLFSEYYWQVEAKPPIPKVKIQTMLNFKIDLMTKIQDYYDSRMKFFDDTTLSEDILSIIINCKGEVLRCKMAYDNIEINKELLAFFSNIGLWEPGKYDGDKVDSNVAWRFKVRSRKITFK